MQRVQLLKWAGLVLVIAIPGGALAGNEPPEPYPPLKPVAIRPARNAFRLLEMCEAVEATRRADCKAYRVCEDPLAPGNPLPAADTVGDLCPPELPSYRRAPSGPTTAESLGFGSTWQSDVLSGLAMFLVERAKAEALASFAYQLKTQLCTTDEGVPAKNATAKPQEAKADQFLPTTCAFLKMTDPYAGQVVWTALKAAFEADLRALPERAVAAWVGVDPGQPLIALVQAMALLGRGDDPFQVLAGLRIKYESIDAATCDKRPRACYLRLVGIVAETFAPPADGHGLSELSPEKLSTYLQLSVRILSEEARSIGLLQDLPARYASDQRAITAVVRLIDDVRTGALDAAGDASSADKAIRYLRAVAAVFEGFPIAELAPRIAGPIDPAQLAAALDHLSRALGHVRAREYVQGFVELEAALGAVDAKLPAWFTRYGGFLAEVAAARGKNEAKQAFESAAAPVGAWRNKRGAGRKALTLTGYVGVQGGVEWLGGDAAPSNRALHGGLFAPVGFEVDRGFGKGWSLGVLFSVIDLGALLDFRESSTQMTASGRETIDDRSNVGVRQVFAPGVFGVLGIGGSREGVPLTLGAGLSLAPELRSMGLEGGTSRELDALRISLFAAIDVTIFGF